MTPEIDIIKTDMFASIEKLSLAIIAKDIIEINAPKIRKIIPKYNEKYENKIETISQIKKGKVEINIALNTMNGVHLTFKIKLIPKYIEINKTTKTTKYNPQFSINTLPYGIVFK